MDNFYYYFYLLVSLRKGRLHENNGNLQIEIHSWSFIKQFLAATQLRCLSLRGWWLSSLMWILLSGSIWILTKEKGLGKVLLVTWTWDMTVWSAVSWLCCHWRKDVGFFCNPEFIDPNWLDLTLNWNLTLSDMELFKSQHKLCWTKAGICSMNRTLIWGLLKI